MILLSAMLMALTCGLDIDSLAAALHVETGMAYMSQGLPDRAVFEFNRAIELDQDQADAYLGLGRAASLRGSPDASEEYYITYMEMRPHDPRAPLEMAEMLIGFPNRLAEAEEYALRALELAPLDGACWLALAAVEAALGNTSQALDRYSRTIAEHEEFANEARLRMAAILYTGGELSQAREVLLPAASSGEAGAYRLLTLVYLDQNDRLRARDSAQRYLFLEPGGNWADSAQLILQGLSPECYPHTPEE